MKQPINARYVFYLISAFLFVYLAIRTYSLSITHDEVGTFLNYGDIDVWTCFWNEACWKNANNHLLNTLLMQLSVWLFGVDEWTLRLPNLIGFAIYLYFSNKIIESTHNNFWLSFLGYSLLCFNPYLLDFFGLARGYGLSISFLLGALYFLKCYYDDHSLKYIWLTFIFSFLGILANFTLMIVFVAIWASIFSISTYAVLKNQKTFSRFLSIQSIPLIISILLGILLFKPISILKTKGEFLWGASSLKEMFWDLTINEMYGERYLGNLTSKVYFYISFIIIALSIFTIVFYSLKKLNKSAGKKFHLSLVLLFMFICLGLFLQNQVFDAKYLHGRKSLLFIPICSLLVYSAAYYLSSIPKKICMTILIVFGFMISYHFIRTANIDHCKEWAYDKNSKAVVEYIENHRKESDQKVSVGAHWLFFPSFEFYRRFEFDFFELGPYSKQADMKTDYDYFYIYKDQTHLMAEKYSLIKEFDTGNLYLLDKE